jgi:hypothetical protein
MGERSPDGKVRMDDSPWKNGVAERWIGNCRTDPLHHVSVVTEQHMTPVMNINSSEKRLALILLLTFIERASASFTTKASVWCSSATNFAVITFRAELCRQDRR